MHRAGSLSRLLIRFDRGSRTAVVGAQLIVILAPIQNQ